MGRNTNSIVSPHFTSRYLLWSLLEAQNDRVGHALSMSNVGPLHAIIQCPYPDLRSMTSSYPFEPEIIPGNLPPQDIALRSTGKQLCSPLRLSPLHKVSTNALRDSNVAMRGLGRCNMIVVVTADQEPIKPWSRVGFQVNNHELLPLKGHLLVYTYI